MQDHNLSPAGMVSPAAGSTDEQLVERSNNRYKMLKKETRAHKKPIRYSHVETTQYEKMGNLFNVFAQSVMGYEVFNV